MKKIGRKLTCLLMACAIGGTVGLTACGGGNDGPAAEVDANYEWLGDSKTDTSQLTSWADLGQSRTMTLTAWNTDAKEAPLAVTATNDVVYPEIKRVTGVTMDTNVWHNQGSDANTAFGKFSISGYPDIAYGASWVNTQACYDLTDLVKKYCPTIMSRMPESVWNQSNINGGQAGKIYAIPYGVNGVGLSSVDDEAKSDSAFNRNLDYYPYVMVREDVLKEAYPQAKTTAEIEAQYKNVGTYDESWIFDVGADINSAEDFRTEFLPKIYNAITTGGFTRSTGERIDVMPAGNGVDTWDLMGLFIPQLLGATGNYYNTQHTYWDAEDQQMQNLMKQDFYQAELQEWVKLIGGNYVTKFGLNQTSGEVSTQYANGNFAIGYGYNTRNSGGSFMLNGEKVNYRRVYLKIEKSEHFEFFDVADAKVSGISIFKKNVREEDLPQILRWLDYQCSELCDKLVAWGPDGENALFTEDANGVRTFKDAELRRQMVEARVPAGSLVEKYNLHNASVDPVNRAFTFFYQGGSKYQPVDTYDIRSVDGAYAKAYNSTWVWRANGIKSVPISLTPNLSSWKNSDLSGVESVWAGRPSVETALKKLLNVGSSNYASNWSTAVATMNSVGWTDEYFSGDCQEMWLAANANYTAGFIK